MLKCKHKQNYQKKMEDKKVKIKISKDGPYIVSGNLPLAKEIIVSDNNGDSVGYKKGEVYECPNQYALCRCGASKNAPFCDGSHSRVGFDGNEIADRARFGARCEKINGPDLDLDDLPELCAWARFCHDHVDDVPAFLGAVENDACGRGPPLEAEVTRHKSIAKRTAAHLHRAMPPGPRLVAA